MLALCAFADGHVGFEPDEFALGIEIHAAAPRGAFGAGPIKQIRGNGRVSQRTPRAPALVIQLRADQRQVFEIVRCVP